ncbi:class I SAM-dependent methyltransferase [Fodinicurvata halophila]|uniref:Class I SAM-dependent methyltransferase n=1 Tax=Fodinicurvata halophila TaxID=1419723 RepID=A0ABV8UJ06_9PROT
MDTASGQVVGPSTELMLDKMGLTQGSRIRNIAASAGSQTLNAAKRVGPSGHVLATDLPASILKHAKANADFAGISHIETQVLDGEDVDWIEAELFDAVISRVGLIYFPDQHKALTGMHAQLRVGGRIGAITYAEADLNGFLSVPVGIIRRRAALPAPLPGQPGPFSLGDPDMLASRLREAGFTGVEVERVAAPVQLGSAQECLQFVKERFGALHQMLAGFAAPEQTTPGTKSRKRYALSKRMAGSKRHARCLLPPEGKSPDPCRGSA